MTLMNDAMHKYQHALELGTIILGMSCTHQLGESIPPQGVNGLILPYPYFIYLLVMVGSLVQFVQPD
jgi:hypothetical protein